MIHNVLHTASITDQLGGPAVLFIGLGLALILGIAFFFPFFRSFNQERRYVTNKMLSSRNEKEREYWEKRKKELWLSLIPFRKYKRH